jgi:hypothetical protein
MLFSLTTLFCSGINGYPNPDIRLHDIQLSADSTIGWNDLCSEMGSFDDDHIFHANEIRSFVEPFVTKDIPQNCNLIHEFFIAVWQPPKISQDNF